MLAMWRHVSAGARSEAGRKMLAVLMSEHRRLEKTRQELARNFSTSPQGLPQTSSLPQFFLFKLNGYKPEPSFQIASPKSLAARLIRELGW
jgi:hypothetical protein